MHRKLPVGALGVTLSQALSRTQTGSDCSPQHKEQQSLTEHNSTHYSLALQCPVFKGSSKFTDTDGSAFRANAGHQRLQRSETVRTSFISHRKCQRAKRKEYFVWWNVMLIFPLDVFTRDWKCLMERLLDQTTEPIVRPYHLVPLIESIYCVSSTKPELFLKTHCVTFKRDLLAWNGTDNTHHSFF